MLVNQIAVFLENRKGRINDFARVLKEQNVDLISMSIADTKEFGILRAITRDNEKAVQALKDAGFTVVTSELIGVEVDDRPGGLSDVLSILNNKDVDIEYLYSYARIEKGKAIILLKVDENKLALDALTKGGFKVLDTTVF